MAEYRICSRCVMDTSDPDIVFDDNGVCGHCLKYDHGTQAHIYSGEESQRRLKVVIEQIKAEAKGKRYDCVVGVSGGVDSTYVVYNAWKLGLRPLAVHLDNGWDSEVAVVNIHKVLNHCGIDLYTHVIDWEEFKDLQLSFLKASTPDSEIPSDHAIVSLLYQIAAREGVRYIVAGTNHRTESHLPRSWSQGHMDWRYISSVQHQFGTRRLRTFPHLNYTQLTRYRRQVKWFSILNYLDYIKKDAIKILETELGWIYYGGKHFESIYTRFYQGYILPKKFGYDKRRMHFSSLICAGEMGREEALSELEKLPYSPELMEKDRVYVIKKLGLTDAEFEAIMGAAPRSYWDYPSYEKLFKGRVFANLLHIYRNAKKIFGVEI